MVVVEHPHLEVVGSSLPMITIFPCVNFKTELPKSPVKLPECLQFTCSQARVELEQHISISGQVRVWVKFE